jgi:hypothetical protein
METQQSIPAGESDGERVVAFAKVIRDEKLCGPDGLASIIVAYVAATFKAQ